MSGPQMPGIRGAAPAPCILCGGPLSRTVHARGPWRYLQCRSCGLVALWPRPSALEAIGLYEDYLPVEPRKAREWEAMMMPVIRASRDLIESRASTGGRRLLDVGCGHGFFLKEMASRGWHVEGIEVSPAGRSYAEGRLGLRVHPGPLEEAGLPEQAFDVVTLFYVIEHLHDPVGLVRAVCRLLRPGGMVLLRWPHSTPIVKLLGPLARGLDLFHTPYHLYDFSPRTIRKMLELCGLERVQTLMGGHTRPRRLPGRAASWLFGNLGEGLFRASMGAALLPGVSKTTVAFKPCATAQP